LKVEERIAAMPRLVHYTGIVAYRNAWPNDPYLQLWAGLGFLNSGNAGSALGCFQLAARHGFTHWRSHWYRAMAAERAGFSGEANAALKLVLHAVPDFESARAMQRRLSS